MCARVYSACAHVGRARETLVSVAVRSWVQNLRSLVNEGGDRHRRGEGCSATTRRTGGIRGQVWECGQLPDPGLTVDTKGSTRRPGACMLTLFCP